MSRRLLPLLLLACVSAPLRPPTERCNARDDDGDDLVDEGEDDDGDGASACPPAGSPADCDDQDPARAPGHPELCDGLDDDCDGLLPATEADRDGDDWLACAADCDDLDPGLTPEDADGDGVPSCAGDCDDADPAVHPSAAEACDGRDDDCDGALPWDELDADGDGLRPCDCAPEDGCR